MTRRRFLAGAAALIASLVLGGAKPPKQPKPSRRAFDAAAFDADAFA